MKIKRLFFFVFFSICHITSAKLKHLHGLEQTFDLFENRCFVNTLFVGFTANFVLHNTPIQHTTIEGPLPLERFHPNLLNPRNASLWPSWRIKRFECVLNTIAISPDINSKFRNLSTLIESYFRRSFDPPYGLDIENKNRSLQARYLHFKLKSPNYFLFIRDKPHILDNRLVFCT